MEQLISFTPNALEFIRQSVLVENSLGVRVDVVSGGCRGMTYAIDFVKEICPSDLVMEIDGVNIYIAPKAVMFISGMIVDYVRNAMGGQLVFQNPNASSCCGCGKSFCTSDSGSPCGGSCAG